MSISNTTCIGYQDIKQKKLSIVFMKQDRIRLSGTKYNGSCNTNAIKIGYSLELSILLILENLDMKKSCQSIRFVKQQNLFVPLLLD